MIALVLFFTIFFVDNSLHITKRGCATKPDKCLYSTFVYGAVMGRIVFLPELMCWSPNSQYLRI